MMPEKEVLKNLTERYADQIRHRPTACVVTFGCQMNARDSEKLRGVLQGAGFELTEDEKADFVIYNTCTVRENANTRVFGRLGRLKNYKKKNPAMILGICGCMMQEKGAAEDVRTRLPFVDLVFGTFNLDRFPHLLALVLSEKLQYCSSAALAEPVIEVIDDEKRNPEELPSVRTFPFKAGVNIMYGCNNFCSYCIVPYVRGRERSRGEEDILKEIQGLCADGVKEIMLLGQNVNSYGRDLGHETGFPELLDRIARETDLARIRFMTSHPKDLSDRLISVMAEHDSICSHLHLPVQSGSNRILKRMNRQYTREKYLDLVGRIRAAIPDISLTTDIIVGFPGETADDVQDTIDLVREVGFDNAFTFLYSKRTGTPAASMPDQVDPDTASVHFNRLLEAVHETALERCGRFAGRTVKALVEDVNRHQEGWVTGRLEHNLLIHFPGKRELIGECVDVDVKESRGFYLIGDRRETFGD